MTTHDPQSWSVSDGPTPGPQAAASDGEALLRDLAERLAAATGSERVAMAVADSLAIQHHVQRTLEILRRIDLPPELDDVRVIAAQHHERSDGSGYPFGLRGGAIIREARILAVADVLDAMMSERSYRPPFPAAEALAHVQQGGGSLFDPTVVRAAERSWDELLRGWEERP